MQKQQAILPKTLPIDLYQHVLADYLNMSDLIRLSEVFDELDYDNIFPELFWRKKLDTQYDRLLNTLSERKDEESQQINSVLRTEKYREVYSRLQTAKIEPTNLQKKNILELIRKEKDLQNAQYLKNALSEITWLSLSYNQIGAQGALRLADSLKDSTTLTSLELEYNKIGAQGASSFADSLKVNTTLKSLNLSSNQIGAQGASSLADCLKINNTLTSLYLLGNKIGAQGASSLVDSLKINKTLTNLYLGRNQIGDQGASSLADSLKVNTTLTSLYLGWNQIGDQGASSLADSLKVNMTLTSLYLEYNQIGNQGVLRLAESLKVNTTLTNLYLEYNQIGAQGASSFADSFKVNTTLTSLNIAGNQIGDQGTSSLADCLKDNTTLTSLDLRGNRICGQQMLQEITDLIKRNCGFRDQCISALKQSDLKQAQTLLTDKVNANGVLLTLLKDDNVQLEPIQRLFQIVQSSADQKNKKNIISRSTRGTILEIIDQTKIKNNPSILNFLQSHLTDVQNIAEEKEEKTEQRPKVQEDKSYHTSRCVM